MKNNQTYPPVPTPKKTSPPGGGGTRRGAAKITKVVGFEKKNEILPHDRKKKGHALGNQKLTVCTQNLMGGGRKDPGGSSRPSPRELGVTAMECEKENRQKTRKGGKEGLKLDRLCRTPRTVLVLKNRECREGGSKWHQKKKKKKGTPGQLG